MRGAPVLPTLLLLSLAFTGCLGSDSESKAKSAQELVSLRAAALVRYTGPDFPIMHTPRGNFTQLLCDAGVCLKRLTTMQTGPANEVHIAQDAMNPKSLLVGSKDYHADNPTCVVVSVYGSTDGGRTWTDGYPRPREGVMGGPSTSRCESDPVGAFDGKGNGFMITLSVSQGLFTYRTSDVGKTWKEVAMAFEGRNDKNWAATDFRINRVYSITRATCNRGEAITYTDDAGETWRGPFCFGSGAMDFAQVDVGPDGTVYAAGVGAGGIVFAKSFDGGQNWSQPQLIAQVSGFSTLPIAGGHAYRTPMLPDMAVSLGTGAIYVVWHQTNDGQQDVMLTMSLDQGNTWSKPIVVNEDPGAVKADQFIPAVAASPTGDAHVIFFDARNDPTGRGHVLDVYYAHSRDGITFEKNIRVTPQSFVPYLSRHQQQPFFIGDYVGLTASNNEAVGVFPITVNGRAEIHAGIVGG